MDLEKLEQPENLNEKSDSQSLTDKVVQNNPKYIISPWLSPLY